VISCGGCQDVVVRVLVVDDVEDWRRFVSSMLRVESFEIVGDASDGLMAVQLAEQMQPTVVLLDIVYRDWTE